MPIKWASIVSKLNLLSYSEIERIREKRKAELELSKESLTEIDRRELNYLSKKNPITRAIPIGYVDGLDPMYVRLNPLSETGSRVSVLNLKKAYRAELFEFLNKEILKEKYLIYEVDFKACHTGIFAAVAGEKYAPLTYEVYKSKDFWGIFMGKLSAELKILNKPMLKVLFYFCMTNIGGNDKIQGKFWRISLWLWQSSTYVTYSYSLVK